MYSSTEQVDSLVQRFANLYLKQKKEIVETLNRLPEFAKEENPERIQLKTMLSVVVVRRHILFERAPFTSSYFEPEMAIFVRIFFWIS